MITKEDIKRLNNIRRKKRQFEKLDKELTAELLERADGMTGKDWKDISFTITEGHSTNAIKEKIQTLPDWEQYYKTTTYQKINIK